VCVRAARDGNNGRASARAARVFDGLLLVAKPEPKCCCPRRFRLAGRSRGWYGADVQCTGACARRGPSASFWQSGGAGAGAGAS
jgi:hypothetical protein